MRQRIRTYEASIRYGMIAFPVVKGTVPGLLLSMVLTGCAVYDPSGVENRLEQTIRDIQLTSKEMEEYLLRRLRSATPESLQHPTLNFARLYLFLRDSPSDEPKIENADELEIVFNWMEATPTVQGLRLYSQKSGSKANLSLSPEQLEAAEKQSRRYVIYTHAFRFRADTQKGHHVLQVFRDGGAHAVLLGHGGDPIGDAVPLSREGDPFRQL